MKGTCVSYPADPGGTFASDAHRRVMAHLPNPDDEPITVDDLILERINRDSHTLLHFVTGDEVLEVLGDLEVDGHAEQPNAGWRNTQSGFDLLTGPPSETAAEIATATIGLSPPNGGA